MMKRTWWALAALLIAGGCVVRDPGPTRTVVVAGGEGGAPAAGQPGYTQPEGGVVIEDGTPLEQGGSAFCSAGQPCSFTCPRGGCDINCAAGSTCKSTCSGGGCDQLCRSGASCEFTCSGGGCDQLCEPDSSCVTKCSGGGCDRIQ